MNISNQKSFTIIEMIIVTLIIAIGMIGIIGVISYGQTFAERTRKEVIAINIAREGIESVYNIRDTNRLRWSGKKEKCWLKINPLEDDGNDGCENDEWMQQGYYITKIQPSGDQRYYQLISQTNPLDIRSDKMIDDTDEDYIMCNDDGFWYNCNDPANAYISEGRFFRMIQGLGLYDKNAANPDTLRNCNDGECSIGGFEAGDAAEYRFCSVVQYHGAGQMGEVNLCSIITNFKKDTINK